MSFISEGTKRELIEELQKLQGRIESKKNGGNTEGFDEDELHELAPDVESDELFLVTDTGRIIYASDSMVEALGYTSDEIVRKSLPEIDKDMTRASWLHHVSSLKKSNAPVTFESRHTASDGSTITKEIASTYISYHGRNYVLCVGRMIGSEDSPTSGVPEGNTRENAILTAVSEGIVVVDTKGVIVDTNSAADRLLGLPKSEIIGRSIADPRWRIVDMRGNQVNISDHPVTVCLVEEMPVVNKRIAITQTDGAQRILLVNAAPIFDSAKAVVGAVASMRIHNVADDNHEHVRRTSRLLTLHREISQSMVRADSVDELERRVCETLLSSGDYALVWIGTVRKNDFKVHPSTVVGESSDYLLKIRVRYDDGEYGNGPVGLAIKTRTMQVVADTQDDPRMQPWRKQAERSNLYSVATFPIIANDEVIAVLCLHARDRSHFLDGELALLGEIAEMLSFGIQGILNHQEKARIDFEIARQGQILDALRDASPTAWCLFNARPPFSSLLFNHAFTSMLDEPWRRDGVKDYFLSDYQHTLIHTTLYDRMQEAIAGEDMRMPHTETFRMFDGSEATWTWSIHPISHLGEVEEYLYVAQPTNPPSADALALAQAEAVRLTESLTVRLREEARTAAAEEAAVSIEQAKAAARKEAESRIEAMTKKLRSDADRRIAEQVKTATEQIRAELSEGSAKHSHPATRTAPAPETGVAHEAFDMMREGLLCIEIPTPAPRARKEKRLEQFYDDGRVILYNEAALRLLDCGPIEDDATPADLVAPMSELGRAFSDAITAKNTSEDVVVEQEESALMISATTRLVSETTSRIWISMLQVDY